MNVLLKLIIKDMGKRFKNEAVYFWVLIAIHNYTLRFRRDAKGHS